MQGNLGSTEDGAARTTQKPVKGRASECARALIGTSDLEWWVIFCVSTTIPPFLGWGQEEGGWGKGMRTVHLYALSTGILPPPSCPPPLALTWPCHRRHCPVLEVAGWPPHHHSAQLPSGLTSHLQPPGHQRDRAEFWGSVPRRGSSTLGQVREV